MPADEAILMPQVMDTRPMGRTATPSRAARLIPNAWAPPGQTPPHMAVQAAVQAWRVIGASQWVINLITNGLNLPRTAETPRWRPPPLHLPPDVLELAEQEVSR